MQTSRNEYREKSLAARLAFDSPLSLRNDSCRKGIIREIHVVREWLKRSSVLISLFFVTGCENLITGSSDPGDAQNSPFGGLSPSLNGAFVRGDGAFAEVFTVSTGLGPIFNQPSCETCHPGDGRGTPDISLIRFSRGGDHAEDVGGPQLQDKSIPGVQTETLPAGVETSLRMPPPVFGMGIIESIPIETLLALEDPNDADGDGISGRLNWVRAADFVPSHMVGSGPGTAPGRFGRKANVSSLIEQIVGAYHQDIGITSDFLPVENSHPQAGGVAIGDEVSDPELPATVVNDVLMYLRLLRPPDRGERTEEVFRGETLFQDIGCAGCHVPRLSTGTGSIPELSGKSFEIYSDLLLHDVGPDLADNRPDGIADGYEWRTPPLWGLRLVSEPLGGNAFYLHDGRARSLNEAILFHGGEAANAKERYVQLSEADKNALISMLNSL